MNAQAEVTGGSPERRIADLTILYEVSRALQNTLEEERVLWIVLVGITHGRGLGFNRAFVLLIDQPGAMLKGRLAIGPSSPEEASRIWGELRGRNQSLGELFHQLHREGIKRDLQINQLVSQMQIPLSEHDHPLLRVMRGHTPAIAAGGIFQPAGPAVDSRTLECLGVSEFAAAPLFMAEHDIGLLLADNAITHAPIEPDSLRLLQIYAQAASTAIQNATLYNKLLDRITQCERTNRTLQDSQQRLLQAERLSTIGRMAALLAHEIRTPLAAIGGFSRKILRTTPEGDGRRDELQIIVDEVRRLERLVEEVLGYSKAAKPVLESTDINALLRAVLTTMEESLNKASVRIILDLDPQLPHAEVDRFQLRQALINLISNAIDAMPTGGDLTVSTSGDGEYLEIGIADTGVGIAQENWSKLFAPFFTTKSSGTGLGLAIVSQVIDSHKGSLRFESNPGMGAAFNIRLAVHPAIDARQTVKPDEKKSQGSLP